MKCIFPQASNKKKDRGFAIGLDALFAILIVTIAFVATGAFGLLRFTAQPLPQTIVENELGEQAQSVFDSLLDSGMLADQLADNDNPILGTSNISQMFSSSLPPNTHFKLRITQFSPKTNATGDPANVNCKTTQSFEECFDYVGCWQTLNDNEVMNCDTASTISNQGNVYYGHRALPLISSYVKNHLEDVCTSVDSVLEGFFRPANVQRAFFDEPAINLDFNAGLSGSANMACDSKSFNPIGRSCGPIFCNQPLNAQIQVKNTARDPVAVATILDQSGSMGPEYGLDMTSIKKTNLPLAASAANVTYTEPANCDWNPRDSVQVGTFQITDDDGDQNPEIVGIANSEIGPGSYYQFTLQYSLDKTTWSGDDTCKRPAMVLRYLHPGGPGSGSTIGYFRGRSPITRPFVANDTERLFRDWFDEVDIITSSGMREGIWGIFVWSDAKATITGVSLTKRVPQTTTLYDGPLSVIAGTHEGCSITGGWRDVNTFNTGAGENAEIWMRYKGTQVGSYPPYSNAMGTCVEPRLRLRNDSTGTIVIPGLTNQNRYANTLFPDWFTTAPASVPNSSSFTIQAWSDVTMNDSEIFAEKQSGSIDVILSPISANGIVQKGQWWFDANIDNTQSGFACSGDHFVFPSPNWSNGPTFNLDNAKLGSGKLFEQVTIDVVATDYNSYGCAPRLKLQRLDASNNPIQEWTGSIWADFNWSQTRFTDINWTNSTYRVQLLDNNTEDVHLEIRVSPDTNFPENPPNDFPYSRTNSDLIALSRDSDGSGDPPACTSDLENWQNIGTMNLDNQPPYSGKAFSPLIEVGMVPRWDEPGVCPETEVATSYLAGSGICFDGVTYFAPKVRINNGTANDMEVSNLTIDNSGTPICQTAYRFVVAPDFTSNNVPFEIWSDVDFTNNLLDDYTNPIRPYVAVYNNRIGQGNAATQTSIVQSGIPSCSGPSGDYQTLTTFDIGEVDGLDQLFTGLRIGAAYSNYAGVLAQACGFGPQLRLTFPLASGIPDVDTFGTATDSNCLANGATTGTCTLLYLNGNTPLPAGTYTIQMWSPVELSNIQVDVNISRLDAAQHALKKFYDNSDWKNEDQLQNTHYSNAAQNTFPTPNGFTSGAPLDRTSLQNAIENVVAGGETGTCSAIEHVNTQYLSAALNPTFPTNRFIVLLTDGASNVKCNPADPKSASVQAIEKSLVARSNNLTIFTIGFGRDVNATELKRIACDQSYADGGADDDEWIVDNCDSSDPLAPYFGKYYYATDPQALEDIYALIAAEIAQEAARADIKIPLSQFSVLDGSVSCPINECDPDDSLPPFYFEVNGDTNYLVFHDALIAKNGGAWFTGRFDFQFDCNGQQCDSNKILFPPNGTYLSIEGTNHDWPATDQLPLNFYFQDLGIKLLESTIASGEISLDLNISNLGFVDLNSVNGPLGQPTLFSNGKALEIQFWDLTTDPPQLLEVKNATINDAVDTTNYTSEMPFNSIEPDLNFYQKNPLGPPSPVWPTASGPGFDHNVSIGAQQDPLYSMGAAGLCEIKSGKGQCASISPGDGFELSEATIEKKVKIQVVMNPRGVVPECSKNNQLVLVCSRKPSVGFFKIEYWVWR